MSYKPLSQTVTDGQKNPISSDAVHDYVAAILPTPAGANTTLSNLTAPTAVNVALLGTVGTEDAPAYSFTGRTNTGMWSAASNVLNFSTNGLERLRIRSDGNIGIGDINPDRALSVFRDSTSATVGIVSNQSSSLSLELYRNLTSSPGIFFTKGRGSRTTQTAILANDSLGFVSFSGITSSNSQRQGALLAFRAANNFSPTSGGTEMLLSTTENDGSLQDRLFIGSNGNVGINTITPTEKLEVEGTIQANNGDVKTNNGDLIVATAGNGLKIEEGTDATLGVTETFPTGNPNTVTVSTAAVRDYSRIFLTAQSNPGSHSPDLWIDSINPNNSFTIRSNTNSFNGTVAWFIVNPATPPAMFDPDASAFMTAANIVDPVQQGAINNLVLQFKTANLWSKMIAIYPLVGGTDVSHSYNLRNPAAFQIGWNAPATHDANGYSLTALNQFGNTGITPQMFDPATLSSHMSVYCRTDNAVTGVSMGCTSTLAPLTRFEIRPRTAVSPNRYEAYAHAPQVVIAPPPVAATSLGLFTVSRLTSSDSRQYYNQNISGPPSATLPTKIMTLPIYLGASCADNLSPTLYGGNRNYAFFTIGEGLNDTDVINLYSAIQNFQTALGRQV